MKNYSRMEKSILSMLNNTLKAVIIAEIYRMKRLSLSDKYVDSKIGL